MNHVLEIERYASIFITSSWDDDEGFTHYGLNKLKGGLVTELSARSARAGNNLLRQSVFRQRPDHSDFRSLPSGHATEASASRSMISRNLDASGFDQNTMRTVNFINGAMVGGVMWSRVEARRHFASDVRAGYSVGYLISSFIYDSLINNDDGQVVSISTFRDKYSLVISKSF